MIRVVLCDVSALAVGHAEKVINDTPALAGVLDQKSGVRRPESAAAYLLLKDAYALLYPDTDMPRVEREECGKPRFAKENGYACSGKQGIERALGELSGESESLGAHGCANVGAGADDIRFSISHRPGVALVAFAEGVEVGADVECVVAERDGRMRELISRYTGEVKTPSAACEFKLYIASYDERGGLNIDEKSRIFDNNGLQKCEKSPENDPWCSWTSLEAVLKMDGGGFGSLERLRVIVEGAEVSSVRVSLGIAEYALSIAKKKVKYSPLMIYKTTVEKG